MTSAFLYVPTFGTFADIAPPVGVAQGGTNSTTTLNNTRLMVSSGGKIVENAAMTGGVTDLVCIDANGLPRTSISENVFFGCSTWDTVSYTFQDLKNLGGAGAALTIDLLDPDNNQYLVLKVIVNVNTAFNGGVGSSIDFIVYDSSVIYVTKAGGGIGTGYSTAISLLAPRESPSLLLDINTNRTFNSYVAGNVNIYWEHIIIG